MKKQVLEHCQKCAEHHVAMGKLHKAAAGETSGATQEFHQGAAAQHADEAGRYIKMCKALAASSGDSIEDLEIETGPDKNKAAFGMLGMRDSADLNKLVPTGVHGVLPEIPAGLRLIPRTGQPIQTDEDPAKFIERTCKR